MGEPYSPAMALLIYGANGYTGTLIAERAAANRLPAIVGGRRADTVTQLATRLGLTARAFGLDDPARIAAALDGVKAVLNCAGPFSRTAAPLVDACLRTGVHYLDITGELEVLEALAARDAEARAAGITVLPATGFDVVPSDCLAAEAKHRLPTATHLALAFQAGTRLSRGTSMTTIENLNGGGAVRRDGRLVRVPSGWRTRTIDFGDGRPRRAITIPWGDVSTAFHTTGIPNIEVYVAVPRALRVGMRLARWVGPLLASAPLQRFLKARVQGGAAGPGAEERAQGVSHLWAEARDGAGRAIELRLETPEAYELTTWTALALAERALRGELPVGFQTPARACGRAFVLQFSGVKLRAADDGDR
jgi:short subunit dehydrogenase-like uncharacterized protein